MIFRHCMFFALIIYPQANALDRAEFDYVPINTRPRSAGPLLMTHLDLKDDSLTRPRSAHSLSLKDLSNLIVNEEKECNDCQNQEEISTQSTTDEETSPLIARNDSYQGKSIKKYYPSESKKNENQSKLIFSDLFHKVDRIIQPDDPLKNLTSIKASTTQEPAISYATSTGNYIENPNELSEQKGSFDTMLSDSFKKGLFIFKDPENKEFFTWNDVPIEIRETLPESIKKDFLQKALDHLKEFGIENPTLHLLRDTYSLAERGELND